MKNIFKSLLFLSLLLSTFCVVKAQQNPLIPDARLKAVYSESDLQNMQDFRSFKIAVLNYYLDNMYYLSETLPAEVELVGDITTLNKRNSLETFDENLDVFAQKTFNPYLYAFSIPYDKSIAYSLGEQGYLVVYSRQEYQNRLEQYLKESKIKIE